MIDIEQIRRNQDAFRRAIKTKRIPLELDRLLEVDEQRRKLVNAVTLLRQKRNQISDSIAAGLQDREQYVATAREVGAELKAKEAELQILESEFTSLMALVPSLPAEDVPEGETDIDNVELRRWGNVPVKDFQQRDHIELVNLHGMVDFAGAREIAGSRAYALIGNGVLLELAVLRFALDQVVAKGFTPVLPPLLVRDRAMFGTGYFPLGEENAYMLERDGLFLTGTSEVGVVSMHTNRILDVTDLPRRYVGISPCFRREAGAAGRDTKGLYRVHQFQKVEQVAFCVNDLDTSHKEFMLLLRNAEEIMQALELPYRVVAVCTGELGLGQVRKYDIETWMPSRGAYCETHSCSNFHEFQSRRLGIKYKDSAGRKQFIHTLNNTAIASPRILIALLENHQNPDGSINIPIALRPYLGGCTTLEPA
jgi:seryl-tRNA synthetase